jgi:hypothetical protein
VGLEGRRKGYAESRVALRGVRRGAAGLNARGVQIFRVEGEAVADTRLYFDQVQVMTQLGLMPEPATA